MCDSRLSVLVPRFVGHTHGRTDGRTDGPTCDGSHVACKWDPIFKVEAAAAEEEEAAATAAVVEWYVVGGVWHNFDVAKEE